MHMPRATFGVPVSWIRSRTAHCSLLLLVALAGCSHVAPYQREYLARPSMDPADREQAEARYWSHAYEAREGAGGAGQTSGGGCGCN